VQAQRAGKWGKNEGFDNHNFSKRLLSAHFARLPGKMEEFTGHD